MPIALMAVVLVVSVPICLLCWVYYLAENRDRSLLIFNIVFATFCLTSLAWVCWACLLPLEVEEISVFEPVIIRQSNGKIFQVIVVEDKFYSVAEKVGTIVSEGTMIRRTVFKKSYAGLSFVGNTSVADLYEPVVPENPK